MHSYNITVQAIYILSYVQHYNSNNCNTNIITKYNSSILIQAYIKIPYIKIICVTNNKFSTVQFKRTYKTASHVSIISNNFKSNINLGYGCLKTLLYPIVQKYFHYPLSINFVCICECSLQTTRGVIGD